jgi:electron transport complex protein RnfD
VLIGSVLFGAVFMATDYVTCPMTHTGQMIFAAGAGLIIALIRAYGGYPEGTTYAILLMNVATPLIDRVTRGRIYGEVKARA